MRVWVLGLNHKTAPVDLRERLAVPRARTVETLRTMGERGIARERALLSTCNRTEIYGAGEDLDAAVNAAKDFLSYHSGLERRELEDKLYLLEGHGSVTHLFSVTSGLDSMVLGETEITGQVKEAYEAARRAGQTGKALNALFQRSFKVAKHLRTETGIGAGRVGVASVACELAAKIFEDLKARKVVVLGTGEMATQIVTALASKGALCTVVSSHHYDRAVELADSVGGAALSYENFEGPAAQADILIASTHSSSILLRESQVRGWMRRRHDKPLFLIDIAVPRNIEGSAEKIDNVYLYNIDDLEGITKKNLSERESQLGICAERVRAQADLYMRWLAKEFHPDVLRESR